MKRLLVDTGPLLDLAIAELERSRLEVGAPDTSRGPRLPSWLLKKQSRLVSPGQFEDLPELVNRVFSGVVISTGSMVELQYHLSDNRSGEQDTTVLKSAFWIAFDRVLNRLRAEGCPMPLPTGDADRALLAELGPVDDHLLKLYQSDDSGSLYFLAMLLRDVKLTGKLESFDPRRIYRPDVR